MAEDPAAPPAAETPPAPQAPGLTKAEIEELISRKAQELSDQRFAGYQSALDKKFKAEVSNLRKSIGQQPDDDDDERERELADLRRERDIYKAAAAYGPEVSGLYQRLASATTVESYMELLKELASKPATAPPQAPPPPAVPPPAPVDKNNPPRNAGTLPFDEDTPWASTEAAEAYLKTLGHFPNFA